MDTRPDVNSAQAVLDGSISDSTFQRVYRWMVRQVSTTYKEPGLRRTRAWSREAGRQAPGLAHRRLVRRPRVVDGVPAPIRDLRRGEEAGHVAAAGLGTSAKGKSFLSACTDFSLNLRPIKRFTSKTVFSGLILSLIHI